MLNTVGRDKNLDGETVNTSYEEQKLADIFTRLAYGPVDLNCEYIVKNVNFPNITDSGKTKEYSATGISIFPCINLKAYLPYDLQLVGCYDVWDESDRLETDKARSKLNAFTVGINYNFLPDETDNPAMQLHKLYR